MRSVLIKSKMKPLNEIKKGIKLNLSCEYCKKIIYIEDGTIIEGKPLHFECYKKKALLTQTEEIIKEIDNLIFAMQQSRNCFGFNPHKVFTTNLIYNYPIEPAETKEMKKLLDFAMGCYQNGWLEAVNQLQELRQKIIGEKLQEKK